MASIQLYECDLCKREHRPSQSWWDNANGGIITVRRDGINGGWKWDNLCPQCRNCLCDAVAAAIKTRTTPAEAS